MEIIIIVEIITTNSINLTSKRVSEISGYGFANITYIGVNNAKIYAITKKINDFFKKYDTKSNKIIPTLIISMLIKIINIL